MRKSKVETAETRRRIVDVAAREFRANGIHAMGLNDLMAHSGLTRGGFYRHFDSKEHLVAEACTAGIAGMIGQLEDAAREADETEGFRSIVDRYVGAGHRDNISGGCPLAAMGSELARGDENTRAAASQGIDDLVDMLAKRLVREHPDTARADATFALAAMVGAVTLSRIVAQPEASVALLECVKEHLDSL
ncbi:TetR/AcrR family transcriptional repressor of nem operon [Paraburkholderia sp. GAS199]|uniref:TetR/AcrR family transcriptional regulator n=1 Tax=Paraburkholderia sp. GAS199 TaxID=3035126 RepID=UPI003D244957